MRWARYLYCFTFMGADFFAVFFVIVFAVGVVLSAMRVQYTTGAAAYINRAALDSMHRQRGWSIQRDHRMRD